MVITIVFFCGGRHFFEKAKKKKNNGRTQIYDCFERLFSAFFEVCVSLNIINDGQFVLNKILSGLESTRRIKKKTLVNVKGILKM